MKLFVDRHIRDFGASGRVMDEKYLSYVRALPCLACGNSPCDPDHLKTRAQGRNDYLTVPLCRLHHSERGQIGDNAFERSYGVDLINALIAVMASFLETNSEGNEILLASHKY